MQLKFKAGEFEIETFTDGYPMWMDLKYEGKSLARFRHNELKDLAHIIERMLSQAKANIPEPYKHEFD